MPYTIQIYNCQKRIPVNRSDIHQFVQNILRRMGVRRAELSLVFVTDRKIRAINRKFLAHDYPTDVLAFDFSEEQFSRRARRAKTVEGEIYVSAVTAARTARELSCPAIQELYLYMAHGILHLLGYDDHTSAGRKQMREKEKELLSNVKCQMSNAKGILNA